jgi:hypothetical protein
MVQTGLQEQTSKIKILGGPRNANDNSSDVETVKDLKKLITENPAPPESRQKCNA